MFDANTEDTALGAEEAADTEAEADEAAKAAGGAPVAAEEGAAGTDTPDGDEDAPQADIGDAPATPDQATPPGKYRLKLQEAEEHRDHLADQLFRQQAAVFERTCADAGLPLAVAKAAGLTVDKFIDADGLVNTAALSDVAEEIRAENRIPRRPQPNPLAGQAGGSGKAESFGEVLKAVATGSH